jgi:fatty acid desaturase
LPPDHRPEAGRLKTAADTHTRGLRQNHPRLALDMLAGFSIILLIFWANRRLQLSGATWNLKAPIGLCSGIAVGFFLHFLTLFLHEASHFNLAPNKRLNDFLAETLVGNFIHLDMRTYRAFHWGHHRKNGRLDDPENSYFQPVTLGNLFSSLTGVFVIQRLLERRHNPLASRTRGMPSRWKSLRTHLYFAAYQAMVLALVVRFLSWQHYFLIWVPAFLIALPFFQFFRSRCEHRKYGLGARSYAEDDASGCTRDFRQGPFAYFMGGAGFIHHREHHMWPSVPYTRLRALAMETGSPRESYIGVFYRHFRETLPGGAGLPGLPSARG